jgi:hypothetical protein
MKRNSSRSLEKGRITNGATVTSISGGIIHGGVHTTTINQIPRGRRSSRPTEYPAGSIGSDLKQRNYIRYLVQRYHRFRDADSSFGRNGPARFSYAVIFTNIERKFKAPTYFIPQTRFDDLVKHLHQQIDGTILGRNNRARGIENYASLKEYAAQQLERDQRS